MIELPEYLQRAPEIAAYLSKPGEEVPVATVYSWLARGVFADPDIWVDGKAAFSLETVDCWYEEWRKNSRTRR